MGKLDHIIELLSADSYPSCGVNPKDIAKFASMIPKPATTGSPSADELKLMKEWIKEDTQVKSIISWKLSAVVQNMLDELLTT
ncbi:hypothetical protein BDR04DRAFT_1174532 [Suillus decipiens]|nr:hypothetical protein BDR04DRAFT_1174532 [Suillus decipiens]